MPTAKIAIAKTHKYASRESGDTVEVAERPAGGCAVVLVDGQGSGAAAKTLSMFVAGTAVGLLRDGARDSAVASVCHDVLHAHRHGKVSATLDIVTIDFERAVVAVTRNSPVPYLVRTGDRFTTSECVAPPIGIHRSTERARAEYSLESGLCVVVFTDGVANAGMHCGHRFDPVDWVNSRSPAFGEDQASVDDFLDAAIAADAGRPRDDMAVVAVLIDPAVTGGTVRRMSVEIPFEG